MVEDQTEYRYVLHGRVIPERVDFNLSTVPVTITEANYGFKLKVFLSILKSQISVYITSDKKVSDFETLRNIILEFIHGHTDSFGYLHGLAYDVEITSISGDQNEPYLIYGVQINEIEKDYNNRPINDLNKILPLMAGDNRHLRYIFSDLRRAIKYPNDTGVHCYRAIETIRQFFLDGDPHDKDARKQSWEKLRNSLNVTEDYLKSVEKYSLSARHGRPILMTGLKRVEIMKQTWKVVDRFLVYLDGNQKSLDKTAYPEL